MKNRDQIRAHNALLHKDRIKDSQGGGDPISGFPMLVLTDGLLAALTFACEWKELKSPPRSPDEGLHRCERTNGRERWHERKHPGEFTVARAIAEHLNCERNRILETTDPDGQLQELASAETDRLLRRATAETLAFLNYLKRYVA